MLVFCIVTAASRLEKPPCPGQMMMTPLHKLLRSRVKRFGFRKAIPLLLGTKKYWYALIQQHSFIWKLNININIFLSAEILCHWGGVQEWYFVAHM